MGDGSRPDGMIKKKAFRDFSLQLLLQSVNPPKNRFLQILAVTSFECGDRTFWAAEEHRRPPCLVYRVTVRMNWTFRYYRVPTIPHTY